MSSANRTTYTNQLTRSEPRLGWLHLLHRRLDAREHHLAHACAVGALDPGGCRVAVLGLLGRVLAGPLVVLVLGLAHLVGDLGALREAIAMAKGEAGEPPNAQP